MDSAPDPAAEYPAPDDSSSAAGPVASASVDAVPTEPGLAGPLQASEPAPALGKSLAIYSLLRIGLLVVLAAGLSLLMPLILALLFAIVLALPLSWVLFSGPRRRVNAAMEVKTAHRRAERDRLRSALNGQEQQ